MHKVTLFMKRNLLLVCGLVLLSSFTIYKFTFSRYQILMGILLDGLSQAHYSPVKIDDAFSEKVYTLYVKRLDFGKKFLLQGDVDQLSKYRREIDNEVNNGTFEFYKLSSELINKRIKEKQEWYKEILSKPLNYTVDEDYETDGDKSKFSATGAELKKEWERMVKYQVLTRIDDALNRQEKAKEKNDTAVKIRIFDSIEVDARRKVLKANDDWFKRLVKFNDKERFATYLNTITNIYDPHTEYFAPKDKKKFDQGMSGQFEGIGARLQQKDGIVKISEVIVGSPSFKQGELKAGDEIHKVAQGTAEPVDITNMDIDEAIELIKGKKGTEVRLTVKKPDGTFKVIPITRDVIEIEETFAKSVVLNNNNKKLGYIYLPSFYTDFTRSGRADARKCANDMRKEIEKLKSVGIEGLIVDLRDNGGGSLQEVVEMAGLFINKGPIVQVKAKSEMISVMEDYNPDVSWSGPLSIMVNHNSASASEILAAAMQDYKRAVIVGTPTFGKGTVQSFVNLDQFILPQFDTIKPIGEVKITMQKFYRINGGATQLKGVVPDVVLPDPYEFIETGEKEMDFPMAWDEIPKANYMPYVLDVSKLKKASEERTKKNPTFKLIETEAKELKTKRDDTKYHLSMEKYRAEQKLWRDQNKKYEDLRKEIKGFTAELLEQDKNKLTNDTARLGRETRWAKNIAKDIYIHETSNIVSGIK